MGPETVTTVFTLAGAFGSPLFMLFLQLSSLSISLPTAS